MKENSQDVSTDPKPTVSKWCTLPLKVAVFHEEDNPVFGETAYHVSLDDEAGGPFVCIEAVGGEEQKKCRIELDLEVLELCLQEAQKMIKAWERQVRE